MSSEQAVSSPPPADGPTSNSKSAGAIPSFPTGLRCLLPRSPAKKEAKRLEKEAKLAAKTVKVTANTNAGDKKAKAEKEKKQAEAVFVNTTPPGEKKGERQNIPQPCC